MRTPGGRRHEPVRGRHLPDAGEQRPRRLEAQVERVEHRLLVPPCGDAGGEQRLDLGREDQPALVLGVEQRLDAEPVAGGDQGGPGVVPQGERELAPQVVQAVEAPLLVQVQRDLAVGPRPEGVAAVAQVGLDALEVVELPVHDQPQALVLVDQRLVRGRVHHAESRVPEGDAAGGVLPGPASVGPAVGEDVGRPRGRPGREAPSRVVDGDDPAHGQVYAGGSSDHSSIRGSSPSRRKRMRRVRVERWRSRLSGVSRLTVAVTSTSVASGWRAR